MRFIPFQIAILPLLRNCAKFLRFIHQSSPFKFAIHFLFVSH